MNKDNFLRKSIPKNEHKLLIPSSNVIIEVQVEEPLAPILLPISVQGTLVEVANNFGTSPTYLSLTPCTTLARS